MQLNLGGWLLDEEAPTFVGDTFVPRHYQTAQHKAVLASLAKPGVRGTMVVACTGSGKSSTISMVVRDWPGRALVLAHRDELLTQLQDRIERIAGERVDREQANDRASIWSRIVVASVASMTPQRMEKWDADAFDLVIIDEAHHAVSPSYTRIFEKFAAAKLVGFTATPDRTDGVAMSLVFQDVAHRYDILTAINEGVLVPVVGKSLKLDVDLSGLRATKRDGGEADFSDKALDGLLGDDRAINSVVRPTIDLAGDRSTIVFTTGVATAHKMAAVFNELEPDSARAVDGTTAPDDRARIMRDFREGRFRRLINHSVATEGFDAPIASCVVMGRPTKSRSLWTQCVGRGLRTHPGKKDCLVLDVAGNAGKHDLACPEDVLGGDMDPKVRELSKKIREQKPETKVNEAIEQAKALVEEERRKKAEAAMRSSYRNQPFDPFVACGLRSDSERFLDMKNGWEPPTQAQIEWLITKGPYRRREEIPNSLSARSAQKMRIEAAKRAKEGQFSLRQQRILNEKGLQVKKLSYERASQAISYLKANNWQVRDPGTLATIVYGERAAGEEG